MKPHKSNQQTRTMVSIALFAAALVSSIAITTIGNRTHTYWIASHGITPGTIISKLDIAQVEVNLGSASGQYLTSLQNPVGSIALNQIHEGSLLPSADLTTETQVMNREIVPLRILTTDIPADISAGELVNIYWIPEKSGVMELPQPEVVLRSVYLRSIDRKGSGFGSEISVTISLNSDQVLPLLASTASGRCVVVRAHG